MNATTNPMTNATMTSVALASAFLLTLALAFTARAAEPAPAAASPSVEAGMRVNIDPATGRMLETPAPDSVQRKAVQRAPLQEQPSTAPDGGTMVILDDRFHSEMRVEVPAAAGGEAAPVVKTDCAPADQH